MDSQRVSIQDELLNNLLNDITEPKIKIPSVTESNTYFAPISPATTTTTNNSNASTNGVKLLEMLQRGNKPNQNGQGDATSGIVPMMKKDMGMSSLFIRLGLLSLTELCSVFRITWGKSPQFRRVGSTDAREGSTASCKCDRCTSGQQNRRGYVCF